LKDHKEREPMSNRLLKVQIAGRDALPVRAIPFVTAWKMSPDEVANQLAKKVPVPFARLRNTTSFHIDNGVPVALLPKEWDAVVARFESLEARLRAEHATEAEGYGAWRETAASLLPAGVYVWVAEFERDFDHDFPPQAPAATGEELAASQEETDGRVSREGIALALDGRRLDDYLPAERPGDRELNYCPMLDDAERQMVLAGYTPSATAVPQAERLAQRGVPKQEILAVEWPLPTAAPPLAKILLERPNWVRPACIPVGRPGGGPMGSHLWNPALLGLCLVATTPQKSWKASSAAVRACLVRSFPEYVDQYPDD
jgi:hypothetical protein